MDIFLESSTLPTLSNTSIFISHPLYNQIMGAGAVIAQFYPPKPTFTEKNVPSLVGKVFIVTGGNSGVGLELVKILYSKGGTVYIAGRSPTRVANAVEVVKSIPTASPGHVKSLHLDLSDLTTIPTCASTFLAQESRLDVLFNNAGVSREPVGSTTVQGYEAHMGTNCLGHFLLTKILLPTLLQTAKSLPKASVRVVFTSSGIVDMAGPSGGVSLAELELGKHGKTIEYNYSASKAGNWLLASELDKRIRKDGILSVVQNPGSLNTKGWDTVPWVGKMLFKPFMHEPKMGAYTELWAGLSPELKMEDGGRFATAWGRWHPMPNKDILKSLKMKEEAGTGVAAKFWDWCEEQTKEYAGVES
jgi:NAD(P)-dependent dehydrogenase (short-subunit alcohol dehydrogenase family)